MGRGFIEYLFPASGTDVWVCFSAFISYRLPDGSKLHIDHGPACCPTCAHFVIAEVIPTAEAIEEELARYRSGDPETLRKWAGRRLGEVAERIDELERRLDWRQKRQSPPRCLSCGTVGPIPIPMSGEFAHPQTGERVVVGSSGWADAAPDFSEYSPEGERLP